MGGILLAAVSGAATDILKDWLKTLFRKFVDSLQQIPAANDNTIIGERLDITI